MQFKHPELLYALFLLIIPILIHLFQLRKFQKTEFTNVAFLKRITIQTRKSSQLKKWLTLIVRLDLFASLILAFAQPFQSNFESFEVQKETVIYLDNSFSMQMKGNNGNLLNDAINDLLQFGNEDDKLTLFTNTNTYRNTSLKAIRNELIQTSYSANQLSLNAIIQKGKNSLSDDTKGIQNFLIISDFQNNMVKDETKFDSLIDYHLVQLKPKNVANIAIDTAFIADSKAETIELAVRLSGIESNLENIPISLYNGDQLVAKSTISDQSNKEARFSINRSQAFKGTISIDDNNLAYDNDLYFNIEEQPKIKVLAINGEPSNFLSRIFTEDEFELSNYTDKNLDYSKIAEQNLIVINEIAAVNNSLLTSLVTFAENGGSIILIPSLKGELNSYNTFAETFLSNRLDSLIPFEKRITDINFDHPLLDQVFDSRVTNFQYPKVDASYASYKGLSNDVLSFEDQSPFLVSRDNVYMFTAAINIDNSNFKNSPLIVPIFYNIGKQSLKIPKLYYSINDNNFIDIPIVITADRILTLRQNESDVIPLQQAFSNKVTLQLQNQPEEAGIVEVFNRQDHLTDLAFNYHRTESDLQYLNLDNYTNVMVDNSVKDVLSDIKTLTNVNELWKWFVIFAIGFLIMEILILKFLK